MSEHPSSSSEDWGPIGAGTPHARMEATWRRMHKHEALLCELVGYSPVSSKYPIEVAFTDAFDKLAAQMPCPGCCNCAPSNYNDPLCDGNGKRGHR